MTFQFRGGKISAHNLKGALCELHTKGDAMHVREGFDSGSLVGIDQDGEALALADVFVFFACQGNAMSSVFSQFCLQVGCALDFIIRREVEQHDDLGSTVVLAHLASRPVAVGLQASPRAIGDMSDRGSEQYLLRLHDSSKEHCSEELPNGFVVDAGTVSRRPTLVGFLTFPFGIVVPCAPRDSRPF